MSCICQDVLCHPFVVVTWFPCTVHPYTICPWVFWCIPCSHKKKPRQIPFTKFFDASGLYHMLVLVRQNAGNEIAMRHSAVSQVLGPHVGWGGPQQLITVVTLKSCHSNVAQHFELSSQKLVTDWPCSEVCLRCACAFSTHCWPHSQSVPGVEEPLSGSHMTPLHLAWGTLPAVLQCIQLSRFLHHK